MKFSIEIVEYDYVDPNRIVAKTTTNNFDRAISIISAIMGEAIGDKIRIKFEVTVDASTEGGDTLE